MTTAQHPDFIDRPQGKALTGGQSRDHAVGNEGPMFGTFLLSGQEFAIDVTRIRETIPLSGPIVRVPASIEIVEGIIELRGSIIPIINLKTRMHEKYRTYGEDCKVAVVNCRGRYFGLLFDDIREVLQPDPKAVHGMEHEADTSRVALSGVITLNDGKRLIQIIDPDRLLQNYDIPLLEQDSIAQEEEERRRRQRVETAQTILFRIRGQEYAIDVQDIREIIKVPAIERRLLLDDFIKGVISLRGELVTIVDLGRYMGCEAGATDGDSRIIVLAGSLSCGILVDSIQEVITFERSLIKPIPLLSDHGLQRAYKGLIALEGHGRKRNFILLDAAKLFSDRLQTRFEQNIVLHRDEQEFAQQKGLDRQEEAQAGEYDGKVMVSFSLGQPFVMDIMHMREIIRYDESIVFLPGQAGSMEGVLNLRGTIIPIIDLRRHYDLEEPRDRHNAKILIIRNAHRSAGVVVDDILEILKIDRGRYHRVHQILGSAEQQKFKNHVQRMISVTDRHGEEKTVIVFDAENFLNDLHVDIAAAGPAVIERYEAAETTENFVV